MPKSSRAVVLFNGKPFSPQTFRPTIERIKEYLDKHPNEGVFSPNEFAKRTKINAKTVRDFLELHPEYCHKFGSRIALGNPKEIKRFVALLSDGEKDERRTGRQRS